MQIGGWLRRLTLFDRRLVLIIALLVLVSFLLPLRQGGGARVVITSGDRTVFVADLKQDRQVELTGPLGTTVLQIADGAAQVLSSPCRQKICIGLGKARHRGDLLACVPNRLVIRIEGDVAVQEQDYDLLSR